MREETQISIMLELISIEFLSKPMRVMILDDIGEIMVCNKSFDLRKGIEVELPRWLAKLLIEKGKAKPIETPIGIQDIARIHFSALSARTPVDLEQIPQFFYSQAREYYSELDSRIRSEFDPSLLEEKSKIANYLIDIVNRRLSFLLQTLRSPSTIAEIYNKLSPEEQVLLNKMRKIIEEWNSHVVGYITR